MLRRILHRTEAPGVEEHHAHSHAHSSGGGGGGGKDDEHHPHKVGPDPLSTALALDTLDRVAASP